MIVDGKKIAENILKELKVKIEKLGCSPKLAVIMAGDDPVSLRFLSMKKKEAKKIGVDVTVHRFRERVTTEELIDLIKTINI